MDRLYRPLHPGAADWLVSIYEGALKSEIKCPNPELPPPTPEALREALLSAPGAVSDKVVEAAVDAVDWAEHQLVHFSLGLRRPAHRC